MYSLAAEDASQFLAAEPLALADISYYHRVDLLNENATVPADLKNTSVVLIAPRAFRNPLPVITRASNLTEDFVNDLHYYINNPLYPGEQARFEGDNALLRPGVRAEIKRTVALELVWRQSLARDGAPLRVMFATPSGVLRVMPGSVAPFGDQSRRFDPIAESWYREALRSAGAMAITNPRLDSASQTLVVTMSHAVYDDTDPNLVLGVSAMDVPHRRLNDAVAKVAQCDGTAGRECYLLDQEAVIRICSVLTSFSWFSFYMFSFLAIRYSGGWR